MFEFHISWNARNKYQFDESIFSFNGNVIIANFHAARVFAQKMNDKRDLLKHPEQAVRAAEVNAMGLIDEILHFIIQLYREQINPKLFKDAHEWLNNSIGNENVEIAIAKFVEEFPPVAVHRKEISIISYLEGETQGISNKLIALEEMLMLWLANLNPAFGKFVDLFDDEYLENNTAYVEMMNSLDKFFETQPKFGPGNHNLFRLLRLPALERPYSLEEQLQFLTSMWGSALGKFNLRLLLGLDFIHEENKAIFWGPPLTFVARFDNAEYEAEQFSRDLHWMPEIVLIAKSTLVWLDQMSKKYQRAITRLDQIPDEEIDRIASWGFTGLWLIGVWQRSRASQKVKQVCGNPEAEPSAYSLFDYEIAWEIGGYDALQSLKVRCWRRGIRLACDMVPNHTGIDSKWVREHPDWFISLPYSPFPSYTFNGMNLSDDQRYGIFIEDKYYNQSDAAVVFKRHDYWTGDVRYIYHGNDGTRMPWNDTAQLNYLNPAVREAVIQKIISVARMFPVIRFDAAMTLAKRHYQRLWFPEPGSGGDIPTRAGLGLSKDDFNRAFPNEFWREVVDRVAQEVPECLLLAEAFWLMEGYFVRTLGMHRVYNSAFMNMLKNEENTKYRQTIINTIQFNPEILKRYVNFMNNPDEETAIAQFGDGDKYFGICMMLVTMPGLPMFGHGQIEGFHEKYGMEYRKAYWDEQVNWGMVQRHEKEIFPLIKKRYLFAEVANFLFYDFITAEGSINDNVFVYSNSARGERAIVIYNNKYEQASGWVRSSVSYAVKTGNGDETRQIQKSLRQGLNISYDHNTYLIFRDHISGLEYIRNCKDICDNGLYFELGAFKFQVFWNMYEVQDNEWHHFGQLTGHLNGKGVYSISEEVKELAHKPLLEQFEFLINKQMCDNFAASFTKKTDFAADFTHKYRNALRVAKDYTNGPGDIEDITKSISLKLENIISLNNTKSTLVKTIPVKYQPAIKRFARVFDTSFNKVLIYNWLIVHEIGKINDNEIFHDLSAFFIDEWLLAKRIQGLFRMSGCEDSQSYELKQLVKILSSHQDILQQDNLNSFDSMRELLGEVSIRDYLKINYHNNVFWFSKESFEQFVEAMYLVAVIQCTSANKAADARNKKVWQIHSVTNQWLSAEKKSGYMVDKLLGLLEKPGRKSQIKATTKTKAEDKSKAKTSAKTK